MNYNMNRGDAKEIYSRYLDKIKAIVGLGKKINISMYTDSQMRSTFWDGGAGQSVFIAGLYYVWLGDTYSPNSDYGTIIASFKLGQLDGCCGVCVSSGGIVSSHQKKGLGTLLNKFRIEIARNMGFGLLIGTDTLKNEPQRKIFKKNGWKEAHLFNNPRTGNDVSVNVVDLWENPFSTTGDASVVSKVKG